MSLAVGVTGTGVMGAEHARLLRDETSGAHLAAVCEADQARATAAAKGAAPRPCHPTPDMVRLSPVTSHRLGL